MTGMTFGNELPKTMHKFVQALVSDLLRLFFLLWEDHEGINVLLG